MADELDGLLARVDDPVLRADLCAQIDRIRAKRAIGLIFETHLPERVRLPEHPIRPGANVAGHDDPTRATFQVLRARGGKVTVRAVRYPDGSRLSAEGAGTKNGAGDDLPTFEGHLYAEVSGHYPADLNDWETQVVTTDTGRLSFVAWYRNASRATLNALRIAYQDEASASASLQVDFLVLSRRNDGTLGASIVDPHGDHFAGANVTALYDSGAAVPYL